jgi:ubiquinone/menaquinone biosynthesis C-methylase UbiE
VQRFFEQVVADFANMVLHHAEGPGHRFREMARVVKRGGVIAIVDEVKHPLAWMREEHADVWAYRVSIRAERQLRASRYRAGEQ